MQVKRRKLMQMLAAGTAFYGPWTVNRAWAQAGQKKPLTIGLTMDASGQYGASGQMERLGAMLAIREFNEKGGVLGRQIEALHIDTETTPATGSRVAERMITRNEVAFLIGALHSGVANAI
ncbi:MAG TPA: ABC transporter substrate-binding protein, partial [Burkholderiales bacterium]|nr:ABC transporter substrate-binding protein [Burkholderiales bacterium]